MIFIDLILAIIMVPTLDTRDFPCQYPDKGKLNGASTDPIVRVILASIFIYDIHGYHFL